MQVCSGTYKPSRASLKSSLRTRVKEYPRVAALHGIAYVADPSRTKAERIGWSICILVSTVSALVIIFTLMERFQTDPMMNSLEIRFVDAPLDLPRLYICPPWKLFGQTSPSKQRYDHPIYRQLYDWDFTRPVGNWTYPNYFDEKAYLRKFFKQNAPSCEKFISGFTLSSVGEREFNCSSFETGVTTAGVCFILPSAGSIIDGTAFTYSFNVTMFPTRIYATLGEDGDLLRHLRLTRLVIPASLTVELQETITSPEAKVLARSQRKCFFPGEQPPYVKCVVECRVANSLKFCNCVPWYLAKDGIKECQIRQYKCLERNARSIVDILECHCRQSCDNIVLKTTELQYHTSCNINIRPRSPLKYRRTVRFGWADLFVSFGGIAGLFVGCSLLSIIEFGYYFSLRTYCGAVISSPNSRQNVIRVNVLDASHQVNFTRDEKRRDLSKERIVFYDYVD